MEIILREKSYAVMGACFEVYKTVGSGFTEPIYQECLEKELSLRGIPCQAQPEVPMSYKGQRLDHHFRPDFVCFGAMILEIKSVSELCGEHRAQVLNYLKATEFRLGLLVNFGRHPKVEYERLVR